MAQRNYANDNFIAVYFGRAALSGLDTVGEAAFKKQLFMSLIAQVYFEQIACDCLGIS